MEKRARVIPDFIENSYPKLIVDILSISLSSSTFRKLSSWNENWRSNNLKRSCLKRNTSQLDVSNMYNKIVPRYTPTSYFTWTSVYTMLLSTSPLASSYFFEINSPVLFRSNILCNFNLKFSRSSPFKHILNEKLF